MVGFIYRRVGVEPGIHHDTVDKIVDYARNAVNPTEPLIQAGFLRFRWHNRNGESENEAKCVPCRAEKCHRLMVSVVMSVDRVAFQELIGEALESVGFFAFVAVLWIVGGDP